MFLRARARASTLALAEGVNGILYLFLSPLTEVWFHLHYKIHQTTFQPTLFPHTIDGFVVCYGSLTGLNLGAKEPTHPLHSIKISHLDSKAQEPIPLTILMPTGLGVVTKGTLTFIQPYKPTEFIHTIL